MTKVCIVTGGNKGIGYAIVKALCKKFDGIVYLTSRDENRGQAAVESLRKEELSPKYHQLDISNESSITNFIEYLKLTYGGVDVVVNNAAIAYKGSATEPFGIQAQDTVGVNYFDTKKFCHEIFPLLRPHARVVNVSSCLGHLSYLKGKEPEASTLRQKFADPSLTEEKLDELMNAFISSAKEEKWKEEGWPSNSYAMSKIGLSALTRIHQRMFDSDPREDLVINSCHPGYVDTDMTSHRGILKPDEGAVCPVYLALLSPNIEEPKGAFLWNDTKAIDWVDGILPNKY